ncbi:hypothetical protein CCYA_CCYA01G0045 [Cyanidiococcus yangmingshanensis]|nr:hypothetical protein CCYA_CCYA01G0045 [Cyanidiococcus yangmingshanensis]
MRGQQEHTLVWEPFEVRAPASSRFVDELRFCSVDGTRAYRTGQRNGFHGSELQWSSFDQINLYGSVDTSKVNRQRRWYSQCRWIASVQRRLCQRSSVRTPVSVTPLQYRPSGLPMTSPHGCSTHHRSWEEASIRSPRSCGRCTGFLSTLSAVDRWARLRSHSTRTDSRVLAAIR